MFPDSSPNGSLELPLSIPALIARQAAATPEAIAVVADDSTVTYAQLIARADRIAMLLNDLGVGPDALVGVCLPRSIDMVAVLLGVWRAGAGYLPLDPEQPAQRLSWILRDTAVRYVITEEKLAGLVTNAGAEPVVLSLRQLPATRPAPVVVDGANVAYAIYTSGSTGFPKGVMVEHAGIANRVRWAVDKHNLTVGDRVLQKTTLTFDAACWEVFAPLTCGATVVLSPTGSERDPAAIVRAVVEHRITVLQVVPSVLRLLVEEPGWQRCTSLRLMFCAGEPLHAELAQRALLHISAELWNTYGPTECSIDIAAHRFDPAQVSGPVLIGRPIGGMRVLVLDDDGSPAPIGVPGELYAGGVGVARGYMGRPGQTADRFVPDPYSTTPGARLYRTGDRVRWQPDGALEYLGRLDHQVKVNGVRIEPGEIENVLSTHPDVRAAVVTAYEIADGSKRLAAYLQPRKPGVLAELRTYLSKRLPESHIPSAFVEMAELPLTINGKIDRSALPVPGGTDHGGAGAVAPRDAAEQLVADVWQKLLKLDAFGVRDDFFTLGGTSLQLTRLASQLGSVAGQPIHPRQLLTATTVEAQARLITLAAPDDRAAHAVIRPEPRDGALPLSYGQRRLWFMDRANPDSTEYIATVFLPVPADAPDRSVQEALDTLVARHESLRTRFALRDGEPVQHIDPPESVVLRRVRIGREQLSGFFREEFSRGFDLQQGRLLRAVLIDVTDGARMVLLTVHHIVCDGWSTAILESEFAELLAAERERRAADLPASTTQYADYAYWQREQLTEHRLRRELDFWRETLDGATPLSPVTDRPRPEVRDGRGDYVSFEVPRQVASALIDVGQQHGATFFMTLLTAYSMLLARYTGTWDIPIGTPVAGRDQPETEHIVGFFLNSLVLRCALDGRLTFAEALDRVRDASKDAFAHQDLPFDCLVAELAPERDLSRTPLFQVAFDLHDESFNDAAMELIDGRTLQESWQIAHTDLTLLMRRRPDGTVIGGFEYAVSLYERATIQRLADNFVRLLTALAVDSAARLGTVAFLSEEEAHQLDRWGRAENPGVEWSVPEAVAARAAAAPDAVAVTSGGESLSFNELEIRANQLAWELRAAGAGPESVVGVLLERGVRLVVALLAVWKAGACFVPMDPGHPMGRSATMLEAAGAPLLISQEKYGSGMARDFPGRVLCVDAAEDAARIAGRPTGAPPLQTDSDRLAYVIFTSGSTGRPKGVSITHRGLANHVAWAAAELAGRGTGGSALFSSVAFDLVVPNIWAPLVSGQRVVVFPQDLDLAELGSRLVEAGPFSFLKLTPGHLEILSHQVSDEQAAALASVIVVAGEALPAALARRWAELLGPERLINEYGPTEVSVGTCVLPVVGDGVGGAGVVPIGRPLPGLVMKILDEDMQVVPLGAEGELFVGGTGVARGYTGMPGLTAERFVPDVDGRAPGARLYRTGDRARWNARGEAEFLGRVDHQIKIRGYRVDPGEVQSALVAHPRIRDAAVVATGEGTPEIRLVAYIVADDPSVLEELPGYCAARLPEYMVPSAFTLLDQVPLNSNGKLDRSRLSAPENVQDRTVAPRSVVEERIADIWFGLLGTRLGIHDDFFRSGGNSILAIRLIAGIQVEFGVNLAVRDIFEAPTIAGMGRAVEQYIKNEIAQMSDSEVADLILEERD